MIDLSKVNEIYLYTGTTDFRYGIYGLSRLVLNQFQMHKDIRVWRKWSMDVL